MHGNVAATDGAAATDVGFGLLTTQRADAISPPALSQSWWRSGNAPPRARAALCLAGELRTLATYPWMHEHWRAAVLRPLQNPAVFMHVSTECTKHCCQILAPPRGKCVGWTTELELAALLAAFQPVGLQVRANASRTASKDRPMRHAGCAVDVARLEAERGMQFEWVLCARPDL